LLSHSVWKEGNRKWLFCGDEFSGKHVTCDERGVFVSAGQHLMFFGPKLGRAPPYFQSTEPSELN